MNLYQERWDILIKQQRLMWVTETDLSSKVMDDLTELKVMKATIDGDPSTVGPCTFSLYFQHSSGEPYSLHIIQRPYDRSKSTLDYDVSFQKGDIVLLFADVNGTAYKLAEKPRGKYKESDLIILRNTFFQRCQCQLRNMIKAIVRQQKNVS